jgi:Tol biopolymer transport system component
VAPCRWTPFEGESPFHQLSCPRLILVVLLISLALATGCTATVGESEPFEPTAASPAWSPDGASIAYVLWQQRLTNSGPTEFRATARVIDIGHGRDRALFEGSGWHPEVTWSPDSRWLALPSDRNRRRGTSCFRPPCDLVAELYLVSRSGKQDRRLTDNRADDFAPTWSPDGRQLAFISGRDRPRGVRTWRDVYVTSTASGKVVRITHDAAWESALNWSRPDRLEVTRDDGSRFAVSVEAVRQVPLPSRSQPLGERVVAPRSKAAAWLTTRDRNGETCYTDSDQETCEPNAEVYLGTPDGRQVRVTRTASDEHDLAWSPDGRRLAFASDEHIWIIDATGMGLHRVSRS